MKKLKSKSIKTSIILLLFFLSLAYTNLIKANENSEKPEIIIIHDASKPFAEKEALIILPGLSDSKKGRRHQKQYFQQTQYDLYIPNFIDKHSFDTTVDNFTDFYVSNNLSAYKKVHVFSYLLGSWVLNTHIQKHGKQNIANIIYDRSPLQELAPKIVVNHIPTITRLVKGRIVKQFSKVPYPTIEQSDINIGILVENKATPLIRYFKKPAMSYGPIQWNNLDFNQTYDDMIYTPLNHGEMYTSFDIIGADILNFIEKGEFRKEAKREAYDWDVFKGK